jgi:DNA-binding GntR family transcriptional regulator
MAFDYAPPKYAQVVAEIKRRIESGEYPAGSLLPSEKLLGDAFDVSRPTIVKSLSVLRQDGWISTEQGRGSFVRGRPALAGAERTRPAQSVLEVAETTLSGKLTQAGVKLAPKYVTALLHLEIPETDALMTTVPAARAFLRQRLFEDDHGPTELASVWLPLDVARGTDLTSPDLLGESIRHHLQTRKKIRLDHAVERISARKPTGEEAGLLDVATDTPVLNVLVTAYDAEAKPVHVTDIVLPGDRHEIHDAYPFT